MNVKNFIEVRRLKHPWRVIEKQNNHKQTKKKNKTKKQQQKKKIKTTTNKQTKKNKTKKQQQKKKKKTQEFNPHHSDTGVSFEKSAFFFVSNSGRDIPLLH